jgi:hypothetical protein
LVRDREVVLENGEFYVAGVRSEHKAKDTYQLNGADFEVVSERDGDFYVNGIHAKAAKPKAARSRYPSQ